MHRPAAPHIRYDLDSLARLGETADGKRIHTGRLGTDSTLPRKLGRLRESTFRLVGEGTGKRFNTDISNSWYGRIVGCAVPVHGSTGLPRTGLMHPGYARQAPAEMRK